MKKILSFLFSAAFAFFFSQNSLTIINSKDQKPVPNASVYCDDFLVGKTNAEGKLNYKTKCKKVEIIADNFDDAEAEVKKEAKIYLKPSVDKTKKIDKIIITDKSDDRALKILDEVNKRYKDNSPKSLDSYHFKSYSKISMDIDKDSVQNYRDFMAKRQDSISKINDRVLKQKKKEKKDSLLAEDFFKTVNDSQFFLWEKVSEYKFSKNYGEKTNILDTKISGFPNPIYEILAVNISNLNRVPRQINPENRKNYRYYLSDTLQVEGRTTYVIKFKEITDKLKQNPRKFSGKIYVDAENYAVKKIETISKKTNEGSGVTIWKPINNKWFLESENLKAKMGYQSFETSKKDSLKKGEKQKFRTKKFGNYLYVKNKFFDFKINEPQKAEDYQGYAVEVKNTDGKLLSQYRTDSLTYREAVTYEKIDSLVTKSKFDKKLKIFTSLTRGYYRYKIFDFDLKRFLSFNKYEQFRLGAGVKLNEDFNKFYSPDFYFGYGTGDKAWKFGAGIDFKLSQKRTTVFRIDYVDDVSAVGRFSKNLWDRALLMQDFGGYSYNANFYHFKGFGTSLEYDLTNSLTAKISLSRQIQEAKFNYEYQNWVDPFTDFSTKISLKYSPNDKNMMSPNGKILVERKFPQFFANFEKGAKILGGNLDYQRMDALAMHQFKTKAGTTNLKFFGGISSGNTPIWKNFEILGVTDYFSNDFLSKWSLSSNLAFNTMPSGRFYADKFAAVMLSQRLPFNFKTLGKRTSTLDLEYKSVIGNFSDPQQHHFDFQPLNHYYQEAGMVWNRFLGTGFNIGFFYRLGYYQTNNFSENFGIMLKL